MYYQQYGRKYKNINQTYNGYNYDSKLEARYAFELDMRLKAKDIKKWDRQKTLELRVNGLKVCTYRIDFVITHNDGTIEYVECKGYPTPVWRIKWKLFEAKMIKQIDRGKVKLTIVK